MKPSSKYAILSSIVIFVISVLVSYAVYKANTGMLEKQLRENLQNTAFHSMDKIDRMLYDRYLDIKAIATDPVIRSRRSAPAEITARLSELKESYNIYASLSFFDMNRVRIADTSGKDIGVQHPLKLYWKGLSEGKEFVMDASGSVPLEEPVFHFAYVVKDKKGIPVGAVVTRMLIERSLDVVKMIPFINAGEAMDDFEMEIVDKDGRVLYTNYNKEALLNAASHDWEMAAPLIRSGQKMGTVRHAGDRLYSADEEILAFANEQGFMDLKGNGWTLMLEAPLKSAFAPAIRLRNIMLVFSTLGAVSAAIIFLVGHRLRGRRK